MVKIGITGGIGSGKTTICKVFELLGIPVFYADTVAKEIMITDQLLVEGMKSTFGAESYLADGRLNNKYIASVVFNNVAELAKLNALVHPAVFRAFDLWLKTIPEKTAYVLKEAALLFESGSYEKCNRNVLVTSPLPLKLKRVISRDGLTAEQVQARIDKQMEDNEKEKMADFIIENNEQKAIIPQVLTLHHQFLKLSV